MLTRYRSDFGALLADILSSKTKASTKLQRYCGLFENTISAGNHDRSCLCGMLAAEVLSLGDNSAISVKGFLQDNVEFLVQVLQGGKDDGSLSVRGNVEDIASLLLATLEGGLIVARPRWARADVGVIRQLLSLFVARR
ncbi:MAG: hypothetical protein R3C49_02660 [Planctomycetaceae bacterium]